MESHLGMKDSKTILSGDKKDFESDDSRLAKGSKHAKSQALQINSSRGY